VRLRALETFFAHLSTRSVSMNPTLSTSTPDPRTAAPLDPARRWQQVLATLRAGRPVILLDDAERENEADLIVAAELIDEPTMALLIRECSGIVCLCLEDDAVQRLQLPPMVARNGSRHGTAFTVSIEARDGVSTGVSAADRVTTVRAALDGLPGRATPKARSSCAGWPGCDPPRCCAS
jgi:3,4-dihydroxy 2-butanone 4-phosphate synthase